MWFFSPVSSSMRSSSSSARSRASSRSRVSRSARQLDREHAEVARVVELDGGMAGRARRLLVRGEQRVLERGDERARLDSLLALDLANGLDDFLGHLLLTLHRSDSRARSRRRRSRAGSPAAVWTDTARSPAETTSPRRRRSVAVLSSTLRPTARSKCARVRSGRSRPGEDTSTEYCVEVGPEDARSPARRAHGRRLAGGRRTRGSAPCRSARAPAPRRREAPSRPSARPVCTAVSPCRERRWPSDRLWHQLELLKKNGRARAHFEQARNVVSEGSKGLGRTAYPGPARRAPVRRRARS